MTKKEVDIKSNIEQVKRKIAEAKSRRQEKFLTGDQVELVVVSKLRSVEEIKSVLECGVSVLGENRVQEALEKIPVIKNAQWHLIGHLQTNKVKQAINNFSLLHSVDSEKLLMTIDKFSSTMDVRSNILLQVNIANEESKFGLAESEAVEIARLAKQLKNVKLRGMMVIAPNIPEVRPVFRSGYQLFVKLQETVGSEDFNILSMGMSNDFQIAIEEGANMVRVGSAIFV